MPDTFVGGPKTLPHAIQRLSRVLALLRMEMKAMTGNIPDGDCRAIRDMAVFELADCIDILREAINRDGPDICPPNHLIPNQISNHR